MRRTFAQTYNSSKYIQIIPSLLCLCVQMAACDEFLEIVKSDSEYRFTGKQRSGLFNYTTAIIKLISNHINININYKHDPPSLYSHFTFSSSQSPLSLYHVMNPNDLYFENARCKGLIPPEAFLFLDRELVDWLLGFEKSCPTAHSSSNQREYFRNQWFPEANSINRYSMSPITFSTIYVYPYLSAHT